MPRLRGLPWLGQTWRFLQDAVGLLQRGRARYGEVFQYEVAGQWLVSLQNPEHNRRVLVDPDGTYSSQLAWESGLSTLFPNGLMLMDGDRHAHHRGILRGAFGREPLEGYLAKMPEVIEAHLSSWEQQIQLFPAMKRLTLELAGRVFFGLDFSDPDHDVRKDISAVVKAATALPINLPFTVYGRGRRARKRLEDFFLSHVGLRRQNPGSDLFSMLCRAENEHGDRLSDQEIVDHLIFILMAAHDTTASALTSVVYLLAKHPAWQERLRNEASNLDGTPLNTATLRGALPQMGRVLQEVLRLYPPLIVIPRTTLTHQTVEGFEVPKGSTLQLPLQRHHRDPRVWTEPDDFDPTRFEKSRQENRTCPFAYAPFGAGAHHCLGASFADLQMRLILVHILRRFRWSVPEGYVADYQSVPIQEPRDGLPLHLERRTSDVES
ncbi:MAG: cytochrome P450 [Myxococcota bacterium]